MPLDNDQPVVITPKLTAEPTELRAWVRGQRPLPELDSRTFYRETPPTDFDAHAPRLSLHFSDSADYKRWYKKLGLAAVRAWVLDTKSTSPRASKEDT